MHKNGVKERFCKPRRKTDGVFNKSFQQHFENPACPRAGAVKSRADFNDFNITAC